MTEPDDDNPVGSAEMKVDSLADLNRIYPGYYLVWSSEAPERRPCTLPRSVINFLPSATTLNPVTSSPNVRPVFSPACLSVADALGSCPMTRAMAGISTEYPTPLMSKPCVRRCSSSTTSARSRSDADGPGICPTRPSASGGKSRYATAGAWFGDRPERWSRV